MIEGEIAAAQSQLERTELARSEVGRRQVEARELAEHEPREKARRAAERLDVRIEKAARAVDESADHFAAGVAEHQRLSDERQSILQEAGLAGPVNSWNSGGYEEALRHQLGKREVDRCFAWLGRSNLNGPLPQKKQ